MAVDVDPDTGASILERGVECVTSESAIRVGKELAKFAATSANPVAGKLVETVVLGLVQDRAIELGRKTDQEIQQRLDDLDAEEDLKQAALVRMLQGVSRCLPDGDRLEAACLQTASGDPEALVGLLEEFQQDDEKREQLETAVDDVLRGNFGNAVDSDDGDFLDHFQDTTGASSREEALGLFLDVRDLLASREVHETLEKVTDLATGVEAIRGELSAVQESVSATQDSLRSAVNRIIDVELRDQGFSRLDNTYYRLREPDTFDRAWRRGFDPIDVRAGHAADRLKVTGGEETNVTEELFEMLRNGENRMVRGQAGSGKSTICLSVADRWQKRNLGTVLYRESGGNNRQEFSESGPVEDQIRSGRGHVLVVVEDAILPEAYTIYDVISTFEDDPKVSFLLDARDGDFRQNDIAPLEVSTTTKQRDLQYEIPAYRVPKLTPKECNHLVQHFEEQAEVEMEFDGEELFRKIETESRAGEMLHLAHLLVGPGGTGLEDDVIDKFQTLENPNDDDVKYRVLDKYDDRLLQHVGLMINVLNLGGVDLRREYIFALFDTIAVEYRNQSVYDLTTIEALLNDLNDWLVFVDEDGSLRGFHPYWSFLYLRYSVDGDRRLDANEQKPPVSRKVVHKRLATCVRAMLSLTNDGEKLAEIHHECGLDDDLVEAVRSNAEAKAGEILFGVFGIGWTWPILGRLFHENGNAKFEVDDFEVCSPTTVAKSKLFLGNILKSLGELVDAELEYKKSVETLDWDSERIEDERLKAGILGSLGSLARKLGDVETARNLYQDSMEIRQEIGDQEGIAETLGNLGLLERGIGDVKTARKRYEESLEIKRKIGDRGGEAVTLGDLGSLAQRLDNVETARKRYEESLGIAREFGDREGEAATLGNLGSLAQKLGDVETARKRYEESLEITREIGLREGEAATLGNLGLLAQKLGDVETARKRYEESLGIRREIGDREGGATILVNLGTLDFSEGDLESARENLVDGIEILREIGNVQKAAPAYSSLIEVCEAAGLHEAALARCDEALQIVRRSDSPLVLGKEFEFLQERAKLSTRNKGEQVGELYYYALLAVLEAKLATAMGLFAKTWSLRNEVDEKSSAYTVAVTSGVGLAAHLTLFQHQLKEVVDSSANSLNDILSDSFDDILTEVEDYCDDLPIPARVLFQYLNDGETESTPADLDNLARLAGNPDAPIEDQSQGTVAAQTFAELLRRVQAE